MGREREREEKTRSNESRNQCELISSTLAKDTFRLDSYTFGVCGEFIEESQTNSFFFSTM